MSNIYNKKINIQKRQRAKSTQVLSWCLMMLNSLICCSFSRVSCLISRASHWILLVKDWICNWRTGITFCLIWVSLLLKLSFWISLVSWVWATEKCDNFERASASDCRIFCASFSSAWILSFKVAKRETRRMMRTPGPCTSLCSGSFIAAFQGQARKCTYHISYKLMDVKRRRCNQALVALGCMTAATSPSSIAWVAASNQDSPALPQDVPALFWRLHEVTGHFGETEFGVFWRNFKSREIPGNQFWFQKGLTQKVKRVRRLKRLETENSAR